MKKTRLKKVGWSKIQKLQTWHFLLIFALVILSDFNDGLIQRTRPKPPILEEVPETSFTCGSKRAGYYADMETNCQAYHMCDTLENKHSFLCPALTLFNQKFMICDHWYAVDCALSPRFYKLNEKIGQIPEKRSEKAEDNLIQDSRRSQAKEKNHSIFNKNKKLIKSNHHNPVQKSFPKSKISRKPSTQNPKPPKFISSTTTSTKKPLRFFSINTKTTPKSPTSIPITTKVTPKPRKIIHFNRNFLSKPLTNPRKIIHTHRNNLVSISEEDSTFKGRGSGRKIKFGGNKSNFNFQLNGFQFRPFKDPKKEFFDKSTFTVSPNIFTSSSPPGPDTFLNLNSISDDFESDEDSNVLNKPHSFHLERPSSTKIKNEQNALRSISNLPDRFLSPPLKAPVILQGENQEMLTRLSLKTIPSSQSERASVSNRANFVPHSHTSRPNRKFFISSNGFTFPKNNPFTDSLRARNENNDSGHHHMTMTFPNTDTMRKKRPLEINPRCPRCHPAFLRPGQCHPCVIIK